MGRGRPIWEVEAVVSSTYAPGEELRHHVVCRPAAAATWSATLPGQALAYPRLARTRCPRAGSRLSTVATHIATNCVAAQVKHCP